MDLDKKTADAQELVRKCVASHRRPIIMSSFGKDSMVLLSVVESVAPGLPVLFHREPFCPEKYAFANSVIAARGYTVYDYAPSGTMMLKRNGIVEIMNGYQIGPGKYLDLPTGISAPVEGRPYLCGHDDLYRKPVGSFVFPWDVVFIGHKSADVDPLRGPIPLLVDVTVNDGCPDYAFPLRHFTDADIWEYARRHDLPIHSTRYDPADEYRERPDTALNPDYFYACTLCLDPDQPASVQCPKRGLEINNRSSQLRWMNPNHLPAYVGRPAEG